MCISKDLEFTDGLNFIEFGKPFETEYNGQKYQVTIVQAGLKLSDGKEIIWYDEKDKHES